MTDCSKEARMYHPTSSTRNMSRSAGNLAAYKLTFFTYACMQDEESSTGCNALDATKIECLRVVELGPPRRAVVSSVILPRGVSRWETPRDIFKR